MQPPVFIISNGVFWKTRWGGMASASYAAVAKLYCTKKDHMQVDIIRVGHGISCTRMSNLKPFNYFDFPSPST